MDRKHSVSGGLGAPLAVSLTGLLGLWISGCGPLDQSTYASCLREPRSWNEGVTRTGHVSPFKIENDYSSYGAEDGKTFRTTITRHDCKDSLHVTGPGVDFQGGPWLPIWEEAFAANYKKNRLAFAYYEDKNRAFVWLDGAARGPYHDIQVSPRFSDNGEHVAWQVKEIDGTYTLYMDDRKIANHPRVTDWPFLYVLDDGKLAAPSYQQDTRIQVVVGDYRGPIVDELCNNWGFQAGPKGHWGYTAKLKGRWMTVIDGETVEVGGIPSRCEIKFSEDGQRSAYVSMAVAGEPASKAGVVVDRVYHPELERATDIAFDGSIPIATLEDRRTSDLVKVLVLVGLPTPAVGPGPDEPSPARSPQSAEPKTWTRVQIGTSVGPRLDVFEWQSLTVDPEGHVRYRGELGGVELEIVDNVIVKRPAAAVAR